MGGQEAEVQTMRVGKTWDSWFVLSKPPHEVCRNTHSKHYKKCGEPKCDLAMAKVPDGE